MDPIEYGMKDMYFQYAGNRVKLVKTDQATIYQLQTENGLVIGEVEATVRPATEDEHKDLVDSGLSVKGKVVKRSRLG